MLVEPEVYLKLTAWHLADKEPNGQRKTKQQCLEALEKIQNRPFGLDFRVGKMMPVHGAGTTTMNGFKLGTMGTSTDPTSYTVGIYRASSKRVFGSTLYSVT